MKKIIFLALIILCSGFVWSATPETIAALWQPPNDLVPAQPADTARHFYASGITLETAIANSWLSIRPIEAGQTAATVAAQKSVVINFSRVQKLNLRIEIPMDQFADGINYVLINRYIWSIKKPTSGQAEIGQIQVPHPMTGTYFNVKLDRIGLSGTSESAMTNTLLKEALCPNHDECATYTTSYKDNYIAALPQADRIWANFEFTSDQIRNLEQWMRQWLATPSNGPIYLVVFTSVYGRRTDDASPKWHMIASPVSITGVTGAVNSPPGSLPVITETGLAAPNPNGQYYCNMTTGKIYKRDQNGNYGTLASNCQISDGTTTRSMNCSATTFRSITTNNPNAAFSGVSYANSIIYFSNATSNKPLPGNWDGRMMFGNKDTPNPAKDSIFFDWKADGVTINETGNVYFCRNCNDNPPASFSAAEQAMLKAEKCKMPIGQGFPSEAVQKCHANGFWYLYPCQTFCTDPGNGPMCVDSGAFTLEPTGGGSGDVGQNAELKTLYRFVRSDTGDRYYSVDPNILGSPPAAPWALEGPLCSIYASQQAGTVPLYVYTNPQRHMLSTTNSAQLTYPHGQLTTYYNQERLLGYVHQYGSTTTKTLEHWTKGSNADGLLHIYVNMEDDWNNRNSLPGQGWTQDATPLGHCLPVASDAVYPNNAPTGSLTGIELYRFRHRTTNDFALSTNPQEVAQLGANADWVDKVSLGTIVTTGGDGLVPMYRMLKAGVHKIAVGDENRNALVGAGWGNEGPLGYCANANFGTGALQLREFTSGSTNMYTTLNADVQCAASWGYSSGSMPACYVYDQGVIQPPPSCTATPPPTQQMAPAMVPLYRCLNSQTITWQGVRYAEFGYAYSTSTTCPGGYVGAQLLGYLYAESQAGTSPVYACELQPVGSYNQRDIMLQLLPTCPQHYSALNNGNPLGYIRTTAANGFEALNDCRSTWRCNSAPCLNGIDTSHLYTRSSNCEGLGDYSQIYSPLGFIMTTGPDGQAVAQTSARACANACTGNTPCCINGVCTIMGNNNACGVYSPQSDEFGAGDNVYG